ncbi:MAG TPA: PP2C family serine/threonine-protein phosphatase [Casimicrobiaceae bacterium]
MRFTIFQDTRRCGREINEDRLAYTYSREALLLVVADGMGGHLGGEIAAQIIVRLFVERFQQEAQPILRNPLGFMQETMLRGHAALASYASRFAMLETPRTTCVAAIVQRGSAYWAHAGDSRFMLLRQGRLIGATRDHSKVQYLVDQKLITPAEAASHPDRNRIFSCLGGAVEPVIDLSRRTPLKNGDLLILCTDGLWSVYPQAELATMLTSTPVLDVGPRIMREAELRGGPDGDNVSAIIVRWGPEGLADEPSTITDDLAAGEFGTGLDDTVSLADRSGAARDLTEEEIERAIAEIQSTIQKYRK